LDDQERAEWNAEPRCDSGEYKCGERLLVWVQIKWHPAEEAKNHGHAADGYVNSHAATLKRKSERESESVARLERLQICILAAAVLAAQEAAQLGRKRKLGKSAPEAGKHKGGV
jgi:hypothetical protein